MTAALLCANALLLLPFGVAGSLYSAHGEYDRSVLAGMGNLAIQIIVPLILLAFRQPTTVLAAGMIACTLVGWTAVSIDERIRYGPLPWGLAAPTAAELRLTVSNGLYFTAQPITTWLTIQGPILILGHLGAPAATVAFATARTLIGVGRQITLQLAYPFGFELSVLLVREELFALRRLLKNAVSIIGIIGGMLSGVMVVAGAPVMKLWLRGRIEPSLSLIIALAIPVALGASAQLYQLMLMFSNRPRLIAVGVSVYAAVGLSLALALMPAFGATGVAAGLGAGEIAVLVGYLPSRTLKMIGTTDGSLQLDGVARAAVGAGLSFVIARLAAFIVPPSDYLRLIAFSGLWGLAAAPTAFFVLLDPEQRAIIRRSIRARR